MSYLNLKSRPAVEVSGLGAAAAYSPTPTTNRISAAFGGSYSTPIHHLNQSNAATASNTMRTFSPPRDTLNPTSSYQVGPAAAASSSSYHHSSTLVPSYSSQNAAVTTTTTTTTGPSSGSAAPLVLTVPISNTNPTNDPSAFAPASTVLRIELEHAKSALERQTEVAQRLEREKRQLLDQLEVVKRDAREAKEAGAHEWRKRVGAASDDNERLRSDMTVLHEEISTLKAQLAESQRSERRAEGMAAKLKDAEDALHRQEVATNEARRAKHNVERDLEELRRNNPAVVLNSKIQQLMLDVEAGEKELRQKQTEIVTITKQLAEAGVACGALEERLRAEERHSAALVTETQELSKRLLENDRKHLEREGDLKKTIHDLENNLKLALQRVDEATHSRDMAESTLSSAQREHKRQTQGTDLHLAQRGAEIESLNKQLDVYKNKVTEITRELTEVETRASNDRKIRDAQEAEISRFSIIQQDLKLSNDRLQREYLRVEKDNDVLFQQLNALNSKMGILVDEKSAMEKSLEAANIKIEMGVRTAADLEHTEKLLSERRVQIGELESKVRAMEPFGVRCEALTTMNDALRAEVAANRNEMTALKVALEEERDGHCRTANRVKLLEVKLTQSDDRHEELYGKLKTLELLNNGERSNQIAGTFAALHEKINSADADNVKILEVNAALMKEVKQMDEAMKEMERQVSRSREITREAEMAKVQAEIAHSEALQRLNGRETELTIVSNQYALTAPTQVAAERRSYAEAIETLQASLKAERDHNSSLQQQLKANEGLSSVISAEKELNKQLHDEVSALRGGSRGGALASSMNSRRLSSPARGSVGGGAYASASPPPHPTNHHLQQESIVYTNKSLSETPNAAADNSSVGVGGAATRTTSPPRSGDGQRTQAPSMDASVLHGNGGPITAAAERKEVSPLRVASRNASPHRAPTIAPSTTSSSAAPVVIDSTTDAIAGMARELMALRQKNEEERADRDGRIEMLATNLAGALQEMKAIRAQREAAESRAANGNSPSTASRLGRMGSGAVGAPHRALTGGAVSPTRHRFDHVENVQLAGPDSPYTSPYRKVGGGGVVMVSSPLRVVSPSATSKAPRKATPAAANPPPPSTSRSTTVTINNNGSHLSSRGGGGMSPTVVARTVTRTAPVGTSSLYAPTAASRAKQQQPREVTIVGNVPLSPRLRQQQQTSESVITVNLTPQSRRRAANFDIADNGDDDGDYYPQQQQQQQQQRSARYPTAAAAANGRRASTVVTPSPSDIEEEHQQQQPSTTRRLDPATLDDEELLAELEEAKRRMKRVLTTDRMAASPSPGKNQRGAGAAVVSPSSMRARY